MNDLNAVDELAELTDCLSSIGDLVDPDCPIDLGPPGQLDGGRRALAVLLGRLLRDQRAAIDTLIHAHSGRA